MCWLIGLGRCNFQRGRPLHPIYFTLETEVCEASVRPDASTHLAGLPPKAWQISNTVSVLRSEFSYWVRVITNKLPSASCVMRAVSFSSCWIKCASSTAAS